MVSGGPAMIGDTLVVGSPEALDACLTDGVAATFVFVAGGDVADALVQSDAVVVAADPPPEPGRTFLR